MIHIEPCCMAFVLCYNVNAAFWSSFFISSDQGFNLVIVLFTVPARARYSILGASVYCFEKE